MASKVSLRWKDRAFVVGASGTGKSTLCAYLINEFRLDYPNARIMVIDTKPRWRAERLPDGTPARKLYKAMGPGDTINGAVSLSSMRDWNIAWDKDANPSGTVIVQRIQQSWNDASAGQEATVRFAVQCMERFFSSQNIRVPSLLYIDEGHDFFHNNGLAKYGDVIQRSYRAGREKGLSTLAGFQRPAGMNLQCMTEANYCALFRINFSKDVRKLYDMGWPPSAPPPAFGPGGTETHEFRLWRGSSAAPVYRLSQREKVSNAG